MGEEIFPVIEESGRVIGQATRKFCHSGSKLLHPVVHLHVFNSNGEIYLQKRADWKDIQPGKWDTAVGGHVDYGEKIEDALKREAREELGIEINSPNYLFHYVFESKIEKEMVNAYYIIYNNDIFPDKSEIEEGRFWSLDEVKDNLGKNVFTPNFESEIIKVFDLLSDL
ncbi:MAG: NUDIX domain-containing protein [Bacteroidales bacterium]|nr:NUDIX domain-containing protein [Bacteroidales bacterium]